jgi:AcrR family transcriptional regulator
MKYIPQIMEKCGETGGENMKETTHEDLRILRTREAINKTFTEMLLKMSYDNITVKELAKQANINRKTFYLHYDSLDDLLEELQQKIADEFVQRIAPFKGQNDIAKLTREFFMYTLEGDTLKQHINCDDSCRFIYIKVNKKIMAKSEYTKNEPDKYRQNIISAFITTASLEIFRQWVADGKKIPLEDIITLTTQLLCNGVHGIERPLRSSTSRKDNTKIF